MSILSFDLLQLGRFHLVASCVSSCSRHLLIPHYSSLTTQFIVRVMRVGEHRAWKLPSFSLLERGFRAISRFQTLISLGTIVIHNVPVCLKLTFGVEDLRLTKYLASYPPSLPLCSRSHFTGDRPRRDGRLGERKQRHCTCHYNSDT